MKFKEILVTAIFVVPGMVQAQSLEGGVEPEEETRPPFVESVTPIPRTVIKSTEETNVHEQVAREMEIVRAMLSGIAQRYNYLANEQAMNPDLFCNSFGECIELEPQ